MDFKCSLCNCTFDHELLVRTHMALADDPQHDSRNGFMPEDEVYKVDDEGDIIETRTGDGNQATASIDVADLPDGLSVRDTHVMEVAVQNSHLDTYQELVDRINGKLRADGLQEQPYTTLLNRLKELFCLDGGSTDDVAFKNLDADEQAVVREFAENPSISLTELADSTGVEAPRANRIIEQYRSVIADLQASDDEQVSDMEAATAAGETPAGGDPRSTGPSTDSTSGQADDDEETTRNPDELRATLLNAAADCENLYAAHDVNIETAETKVAIVEYLARHPDAKNREVETALDCSTAYPSRVRDQHPDLIRQRARKLGTDLSRFEDSEARRQQKQAESWDDLTDRQRTVLRRLADEDNPLNPDTSRRDIIGDLPFDDHPSNVSNIITKYGHFAVKLKRAREQASDEQDPEDIINQVTLSDPDSDDSTDSTGEVDETATPAASPPTATATPSLSAEDVTLDDIRRLLQHVRTNKEIADRERELGEHTDISLGKYVMAEQIEQRIVDLFGDELGINSCADSDSEAGTTTSRA